MDNDELEQHYDKVYAHGSSNYYTTNSFEESQTILKIEKRFSNQKILEIGCGEGRLSCMVAMAGADYVLGVDYSDEAISIANNSFRLPNLEYKKINYKEVNDKFDIVLLQGVLEHFDSPFEELKWIIENQLNENGRVITSSPSFLNPRGYIWMTLQLLLDVPMSLSDLHFLCPFDFEEFCLNNDYDIEYISSNQDWGSGKLMLQDMTKRLTNALRDANLDNSKVERLIDWCEKSNKMFQQDKHTGANVIYKIKKRIK